MLVPVRYLEDGVAAVIAFAGYELLVDPEDYPRVSRQRLILQPTGVYRVYGQAGRTRRQSLAQWLLSPPRGARVRTRNRNHLDCRRQNLVVSAGTVRLSARCHVRPWRATVSVSGRLYDVGYWPSKQWALEILDLVAPVAAECRALDLKPREIAHRLRCAAGLAFEAENRRSA